ncbi:MAG: RNA polymerase sigma factor, partial [Candidatus Poribacteria bacterium]
MKATDASPTDAELVEKCLAGDLNAFGKIVNRYRNTIYGLCYHKVRNFEDAEELAQNTFLRAYLSLKQLRDATKLAPWLYSIATNVCKMWLRAQKEEEVPLDEFVSQQDISPSPQEQLETEELHSLVRMALN